MKFLVVLIAVCLALTSATYNFGRYGSRYPYGLGKGFGYNYRLNYRPSYRLGYRKGYGLGNKYRFRKGYGRKLISVSLFFFSGITRVYSKSL